MATRQRGEQMIVVVGRVRTDAEKRAELVQIARTVVAASRQDEGCISYRFYEDTEVANDFVFIEEWESDDALQKHFATAHIAEFMRAVPAALTAPPDVRFHTVEASRNLADVGRR
jgi:quinol monooxygenase YgiN